MHPEGSQCMADYLLLGEVFGELSHTHSPSLQVDLDVCLFVLHFNHLQGSHHLHLNLSKWSLKLTFMKTLIYLYLCVGVRVYLYTHQEFTMALLWRSGDILASIMWVHGDQIWIIRHDDNCLYALNHLPGPQLFLMIVWWENCWSLCYYFALLLPVLDSVHCAVWRLLGFQNVRVMSHQKHHIQHFIPRSFLGKYVRISRLPVIKLILLSMTK